MAKVTMKLKWWWKAMMPLWYVQHKLGFKPTVPRFMMKFKVVD